MNIAYGGMEPDPDGTSAGSSEGYGLAYWLIHADGSAERVHLPSGTPSSAPAYPFDDHLSDVKSIASSNINVTILHRDGTVWSEGSGYFGSLGNGTKGQTATSPVQVTGLSDITQIASIGVAAFALRSDGTVWGWGSGSAGNLGNGSAATHSTPIQIPGLSHVVWLDAGGSGGAAYAVKDDGTVWVWGCGSNASHGNGSIEENSYFAVQQVPGLTDISRVEADSLWTQHAIGRDGRVWVWGNNNGGSSTHNFAGIGSPDDYITTPTVVPNVEHAVDARDGLVLRDDGRLYSWAADSKAPQLVAVPNHGSVLGRAGVVLATHTVQP